MSLIHKNKIEINDCKKKNKWKKSIKINQRLNKQNKACKNGQNTLTTPLMSDISEDISSYEASSFCDSPYLYVKKVERDTN